MTCHVKEAPGPFLLVLLQKNACQHIGKGTTDLFASPQCTGYDKEYQLTKEMCWPSKKAIAKKTRQFVKKYKAKSVFVAADSDPMFEDIKKELKTLKAVVSNSLEMLLVQS